MFFIDTGCPPLPPISGFIGREDAALLIDKITPFRATGTNLYFLQQPRGHLLLHNLPQLSEILMP